MSEPTIDTIPSDEFTAAVEAHFNWAATWDGALPPDTFFGVWADLQKEKKPTALKARVVKGRLHLTAPSDSGVKVADNRIFLENGAELVIELETAV